MIGSEFVGPVVIGSGGKITLPLKALEALSVTDGDDLLVFVGPLKKRIILAKPDAFEENIDQLILQLKNMKRDYDSAK